MIICLMLALSGHYAPTILHGTQRWRDDTQLRYPRGLPHYILAAVFDGVHRIESRGPGTIVHGESAYLLRPGEPWLVIPSPGSRAIRLNFIVRATELKDGSSRHQTRHLVDPGDHQPPPREVWGIDLPIAMPPGLAPRVVRYLRHLCALWWRDDIRHFQANQRLGALLERIVTHCRGDLAEEERDPEDAISKAIVLALTDTRHLHRVADLAAAVGMSRSHFTRVFTAATSEPPEAFLTRTRMERAERLLRESQHSIAEVARETGFTSAGGFTHAFTRTHGCPPSAWRRMARSD